MNMSSSTQSSCKACSTALSDSHKIARKDDFDLLKCPVCATVTVSPFPTVDDLIRFYQSYVGTTDYTKKKDRKISRARRRIKRLMNICKGIKFLDIGCNYGFTVKAALELGLDARGIDIDQTAVRASGEMFGSQYFETISVQDFAARGEKADIVYTSEVIEHVPDPDLFAASVAKILNPGGILFLTTPDAGHFAVPRNFAAWTDVMPPEHLTYFTKNGLIRLFSRHGLSHINFGFNLKPGIRMTARKE